MKEETIDSFIQFADAQAKENLKKVDLELYNFLLHAAEELVKLSEFEKEKIIAILEKVNEKSNSVQDSKKITEIYFYEGEFSRTSRNVQQTILYLTSFFFKIFIHDDLLLLEELILKNKEHKGNLALELYLKIGKDEPHNKRVLYFIKENLDYLTENQINQSIYTFVQEYEKNEIIEKIIIESGIFEEKEEEKKKRPWWKFW
ncbi:hypothetical protein [Aureivirga marina]|uniref:hypothetical protein n=1 Tax=Aureivirga marina TaxID=1182451 RepID=UPI0018CAB021|nr:hypothetical protein [Aureivirga marina]